MSKRIFTYLLLALFAAVSCDKNTEFVTQETGIESFINSKTGSNPDYRVVRNDGVARLIVKEGEGEELDKNGTISFYYAGYAMKGSSISAVNMFATNEINEAKAANWKLSDESEFEVVTLTLSETELVDGLKRGLEGVKGGEECYILFSGKYGYGKKPFGIIPAKSALVFHIWVESISNE